jgi:hypothetical protein
MTFVRKKHTPFAAGAKVCNAIQGPLSDKKSLWDAALSAVGSISRVPLKPQPQGALGSTRKNAILRRVRAILCELYQLAPCGSGLA